MLLCIIAHKIGSFRNYENDTSQKETDPRSPIQSVYPVPTVLTSYFLHLRLERFVLILIE